MAPPRGDLRHDKNILDESLAGRHQSNRLPDAADNSTAPLRGLQWTYAINLLVLQNDRPHHSQNQCVFLAGRDQVVNTKLERRETAFVKTDNLAVQPDFGQVVHGVELQSNNFTSPACRNLKFAPVEGHAFVVLLDQLPATGDLNLTYLRLLGERGIEMPACIRALVLLVENDLPGSVQSLHMSAVSRDDYRYAEGRQSDQKRQANVKAERHLDPFPDDSCFLESSSAL